MAPRRIGRLISVSVGSRPSSFSACDPTDRTSPLYLFSAITEGSFNTTPSVGVYTIVLTVPKSIAKSSPKKPLRIFIVVTSFWIDSVQSHEAYSNQSANRGQDDNG